MTSADLSDFTVKSKQTKMRCFLVRQAVAAWLAERETMESSGSRFICGTWEEEEEEEGTCTLYIHTVHYRLVHPSLTHIHACICTCT